MCISKATRFRTYFLLCFRLFFNNNSHYGSLFANSISLYVKMMTKKESRKKQSWTEVYSVLGWNTVSNGNLRGAFKF